MCSTNNQKVIFSNLFQICILFHKESPSFKTQLWLFQKEKLPELATTLAYARGVVINGSTAAAQKLLVDIDADKMKKQINQ